MLRSKCYPENLVKLRFTRFGKNLNARLANVQSWGLGSAASPLVGSKVQSTGSSSYPKVLKA